MAPLGDHVVDVGVELFPGSQDDGRVVGDVPAEDLEDVVGPAREQLPVLRGAPSSAQMIGIGYCWAMSVTTSQRPAVVKGSISSVMTSTMVVPSRPTARGVKALTRGGAAGGARRRRGSRCR